MSLLITSMNILHMQHCYVPFWDNFFQAFFCSTLNLQTIGHSYCKMKVKYLSQGKIGVYHLYVNWSKQRKFLKKAVYLEIQSEMSDFQ